MEFNDAKKKFFKRNQTLYTSVDVTVYDYEAAALAEVLSLPLPINVEDTWRNYFAYRSMPNPYTANLSDLWYSFLGGLGYTGSLRDRQKAYFESNETLSTGPAPEGSQLLLENDNTLILENGNIFILEA